jgi:putative SOS response-associated peptidase YedK
VITPEPDGFLMFIHDKKSWVILRLESVKAWLDEHEQEYAGLTPLQEEFTRTLESGEIRPFGEGDGGSPASGRPGLPAHC